MIKAPDKALLFVITKNNVVSSQNMSIHQKNLQKIVMHCRLYVIMCFCG